MKTKNIQFRVLKEKRGKTKQVAQGKDKQESVSCHSLILLLNPISNKKGKSQTKGTRNGCG